jgi:hypothetical protein
MMKRPCGYVYPHSLFEMIGMDLGEVCYRKPTIKVVRRITVNMVNDCLGSMTDTEFLD